MNTLLLFFALPVATIILSIVLQKILDSPILVALTFFAIYLIVTFAAFDESFLVYAIVYTILAYLAATLTRFITNFINNNDDDNDDDNSSCNCGSNRNEIEEIPTNNYIESNNIGRCNRRYWR